MKPIIPVMKSALEQIQELHPPIDTFNDGGLFCEHCHVLFPCETRVLADEGLTGRMARTNQGENND